VPGLAISPRAHHGALKDAAAGAGATCAEKTLRGALVSVQVAISFALRTTLHLARTGTSKKRRGRGRRSHLDGIPRKAGRLARSARFKGGTTSGPTRARAEVAMSADRRAAEGRHDEREKQS
jgi:hypothetical protein